MQEIWRQLTQAYPFIQTLTDALGVILSLSFLLAYSGMIFISATAKILSILRQRSAYEKCARQIAFLGLILAWMLVVAGRIWLYLTAQTHPEGSLENFLLEMSWLLLCLGALLTTIYYTFWRILKNMPILHSTVGMIAGAQNCVALACVLFTIRIASGSANVEAETFKLPDLFPSVWNDPVWSAACFTLPLIFALGGAFSACWLLLRRKHDDFGRDYYNQMVPWCAEWARNGWLVVWLLFITASILQLWTNHGSVFYLQEETLLEGIRAMIWLIPLLLWIFACKTRFPLRHKWSLWLALLISLSFMLPYFLDITLI